jgi:hypothetical protein
MSMLQRGSGSGMEKNPEPGSGMNILDLSFENLVSCFFGLKILQFFDADPGSGLHSNNEK